jgi:hypothetical protein
MPPLELTIPGRYWDSVIYAGRLHLFLRDGSFRIVNWDQLVRQLNCRRDLNRVLRFLVGESDYLYAAFDKWPPGHSMARELQRRLDEIGTLSLEVTAADLDAATLAHWTDLFPYPHAASVMYRGNLYVGSKTGITECRNLQSDDDPIEPRVDRVWDGPATDIAASYGSLAVAAGSEGLWEVPVLVSASIEGTNGLSYQRSAEPSTTCSWVSLGLFGGSSGGGRFIRFHATTDAGYRDVRERVVQFEAASDKIFGSSGLTWGASDRFCQQSQGSLRVVRFVPQAKYERSRYKRESPIELRESVPAIAGGIGHFGVVMEHDSGLTIVCSDGSLMSVDEEPVNWRIFQRSRHYTNHLHIVHSDHLAVWAFIHDFTIDQHAKVAGIQYRRRREIPVEGRWLFLPG